MEDDEEVTSICAAVLAAFAGPLPGRPEEGEAAIVGNVWRCREIVDRRTLAECEDDGGEERIRIASFARADMGSK